MKKILTTAFVFTVLFIGNALYAQTSTVLSVDQGALIMLQKKYTDKQPDAVSLITELLKEADRLLDMKPVSVMDKTITPPSGSKHDYMSQAPYFWYDSSKPNGLPYLRRDGERNPEINKITDRQYIGRLENSARTLGLGWYFTRDEKYARKAAQLLRHWFLDEETKMNPNLDFGQGIPGINTGRGIGIIETIALIGIADGAGLMEGAASWTKADRAGLQQWYKQYLDWMLNSKNGKEERAAKNNHGSWYFAQAVDFALFTGDRNKAAELAAEGLKLLELQIDAEGKQALELERTNALWYSTYNLQAWFRMAMFAERAGIDIWQRKNKNGTGIRHAIDWLLPYVLSKKTFPYQQIDKYNSSVFYELLVEADKHYPDAGYLETAASIPVNKSILTRILYPVK
jgi:hypothetical protein